MCNVSKVQYEVRGNEALDHFRAGGVFDVSPYTGSSVPRSRSTVSVGFDGCYICGGVIFLMMEIACGVLHIILGERCHHIHTHKYGVRLCQFSRSIDLWGCAA